MARNALERYGGSSRNGTAEPPISPRVASTRPFRPTIWIEGGRLGTSSDWSGGGGGGGGAAPQPITPIAPMKHHSPTTSDQYAARPISERRGPLLFFFLRDAEAGFFRGSSKAGCRRAFFFLPVV